MMKSKVLHVSHDVSTDTIANIGKDRKVQGYSVALNNVTWLRAPCERMTPSLVTLGG